jgi:hypothetical protein
MRKTLGSPARQAGEKISRLPPIRRQALTFTAPIEGAAAEKPV